MSGDWSAVMGKSFGQCKGLLSDVSKRTLSLNLTTQIPPGDMRQPKSYAEEYLLFVEGGNAQKMHISSLIEL
jgi:hypothetical protein